MIYLLALALIVSPFVLYVGGKAMIQMLHLYGVEWAACLHEQPWQRTNLPRGLKCSLVLWHGGLHHGTGHGQAYIWDNRGDVYGRTVPDAQPGCDPPKPEPACYIPRPGESFFEWDKRTTTEEGNDE